MNGGQRAVAGRCFGGDAGAFPRTGSGGRLQRVLTTTKVLAIGVLIMGGMLATAGAGMGPRRDREWWNRSSGPCHRSRHRRLLLSRAGMLRLYCHRGRERSPHAAESHDWRYRVCRGHLCAVERRVLYPPCPWQNWLRIRSCRSPRKSAAAYGDRTAHTGGGTTVPVHRRSSERDGLGRPTCLLGHGAGWHDQSMAGLLPDPRPACPLVRFSSKALWASVLIVSGTFEQLIVYSGLVLALFMALSLSTIFRLRHLAPALGAIYRAPFYPILPVLLVGGALFLVVASVIQRPTESLYGVATLLGGLPLYYWWNASARQPQR